MNDPSQWNTHRKHERQTRLPAFEQKNRTDKKEKNKTFEQN